MSQRKKVALAILGSLLLHCIIILSVSGVHAVLPATAPAPAKEENAMPELTLLEGPTPPEERQYVRTNDDQKTDQKPTESMFESDKDTAAASEATSDASAPVPTQEGRDLPDLGFRDESYSLATQGQTFSTESSPAAQPPAPQAPAEQQAKPTPEPTPEPTPAPTPEPTPEATPQPSPSATPEQTELAMLRPTPTPAPTPDSAPRAEPRESAPPAAPRTAYRQQQMRNRMQGSVSNRGQSSIAALGTPQGRFQKAVQDAVGSRWYYYVKKDNDLINIGTVRVQFYVTPDGRVQGTKVLSNSSNQTLESCSIRSITEAEIPPMPDDLANLVPEGGTEFVFSFNFM
jgi:outer membrane biosynthesis protein TonB